MQLFKFTPTERASLNAIADLLMWLGADKQADCIYAAVEADAAACELADAWTAAFAG